MPKSGLRKGMKLCYIPRGVFSTRADAIIRNRIIRISHTSTEQLLCFYIVVLFYADMDEVEGSVDFSRTGKKNAQRLCTGGSKKKPGLSERAHNVLETVSFLVARTETASARCHFVFSGKPKIEKLLL